MALRSAIPPESFDEILAWLNPDRDVAAAMYVQLRHDLAKIFLWNRCTDPEGLTDEVIDRIAKKVHDLRPTYEGDPRSYFHGVARNLIKEDQKKVKSQVSLDESTEAAKRIREQEEEPVDLREDCLHSCLETLSVEKRQLILDYYAKEKQAKIDHRNDLARLLGISVESLRVRVHRIRETLETCIAQCLDRSRLSH
jgi:RNA polymerase sigma factor (sigma-70 family)